MTLELRLAAIALAVVALLAGYGWWHHRVAAAQHDADVVAQRQADAKQIAINQAARDAQAAVQKGNADDATRFDARRVADARGLDAIVQRLHGNNAVGPAVAASAPAACASDPSGVPAAPCVSKGMYLGVVDAARDIAGYADCLHTGGELCRLDYEALKTP